MYQQRRSLNIITDTSLDRAATWTIKNMLSRVPKPDGAEKSPIRIGIATYDRAIHFYNLHVCGLS